jgi:hypothetical protein
MNQEKYIGMDVHQATISVASLQFAVENFWRRPANRCGRNLQSLEPSGFKRQPVVWCFIEDTASVALRHRVFASLVRFT